MRRKVTMLERPAWVAGNLPLEIISTGQEHGKTLELVAVLIAWDGA